MYSFADGLLNCYACWYIFMLNALILAYKQGISDLYLKLHFKQLSK